MKKDLEVHRRQQYLHGEEKPLNNSQPSDHSEGSLHPYPSLPQREDSMKVNAEGSLQDASDKPHEQKLWMLTTTKKIHQNSEKTFFGQMKSSATYTRIMARKKCEGVEQLMVQV